MAKERKEYTQRQKFDYWAEKCQKGSTYTTKDGVDKPYSDFKRGEMVGRMKEQKRSLAIKNLKDGKKWNKKTRRYE